MSFEEEKVDNFVQERLDSLYEIDCKIVSLLDNLSSLFQTYSTPTSNDPSELRESFSNQTKNIYNVLSNVAIDLRKEVKLMDDNIGVYDRNKDNVMILPISVDQKNSTLGKKKLNIELKELNKFLNEDSIEKKGDEDIEMMHVEDK